VAPVDCRPLTEILRQAMRLEAAFWKMGLDAGDRG
jgi:thiaminase